MVVHIAAKKKDDRAKQENNSRKSEREIITIVLRARW